jgi:hypothetical protein
MPEYFTLEMFTPEVDSKFLMHYGEGRTTELQLVSATDVGSSPRQIQFSLIFQGPMDAPVFQSTFRLDHERLGALDLFLVPIGKNETGIQYEAVFNRLIKK